MSPVRLFASPPSPKKTTFKPTLEVLEDRALPSTLLHHYDLNGSLADRLGGPALVSNGGTLDSQCYTFTANQGLSLSGGLSDTGNYSIEVVATLDSLDGFYNKLVDFQELMDDNGLYLSGGSLQLYPGASGTDIVSAGTEFHFALTRDGATGEVNIYVNGVWQQTYTGFVTDAAVSANNVLTFFEDDHITGRTEATSGSVNRILVFAGALTAQEVMNLMNGSPNVSADFASVSFSEGQTAANTGTWSDPDGDAVTLSASAGTVVANVDGTWSWSYTTSDGPAESQTVTISAADGRGGMASTSFALVVGNVAPTITSLTSSHPDADHASGDRNVTVSGSFTDVGSLDTHTVTVAWGDGTTETVSVDQAAGTFTGTHRYARGGLHTVTVTVSDNDGGSVSQTTTAAVSGVGLVNGTVYVFGSGGTDIVSVDYVRARRSGGQVLPAEVKVTTRFNGGNSYTASYAAADVRSMLILGGAGNDDIRIRNSVQIAAVVVGGDGNDVLRAGGGNAMLVGGAGTDLLVGGKAADILIGGDESDALLGGSGRDLLAGGSTVNASNYAVLGDALAAWQRGDRSGALAALGSVINDGVFDYVNGGGNRDIILRS